MVQNAFLSWADSGSSQRSSAGLLNCTTGQLPEGESAFAQGGRGWPWELNSGNMADTARPAQQLSVSNTLVTMPLLHPGSHAKGHIPQVRHNKMQTKMCYFLAN